MNHRLAALCACVLALAPAWVAAAERPNIVLIFTDDQGYGDIGCYGAKGFKTPNLDRLAGQGMRFTDFYCGCSVCSGSRAALLTGRHYRRTGVPAVMFPGQRAIGLPAREVTIAEVLRPLGYTTGIIGKWHLGHGKAFLPTTQGFDSFFGIPYSNDMSIDPQTAVFAKDCAFRQGMTAEKARADKPTRNWVPLMRGTEVIEYPADQTTLTKRYTEEAVRFIKTNKDKPFFLYIPHTMPHLPMAVSKDFAKRTKSLFGDVMEEIDWSVGQILAALAAQKLEGKTLVIFTTDNGTRSGSSGPLRGRKATLYEGGYRVPCLMRWPGKIPEKSVCKEVAATIDMLPTLAKITGGKVPADRRIDGKDITSLMYAKKGAKSPHEYYLMPHGQGALRQGSWKFYPWPEGAGKKGKKQPKQKGPPVQLYDLSKDIGEKNNVAESHPDVVKRMSALFRTKLEEINKEAKRKK